MSPYRGMLHCVQFVCFVKIHECVPPIRGVPKKNYKIAEFIQHSQTDGENFTSLDTDSFNIMHAKHIKFTNSMHFNGDNQFDWLCGHTELIILSMLQFFFLLSTPDHFPPVSRVIRANRQNHLTERGKNVFNKTFMCLSERNEFILG